MGVKIKFVNRGIYSHSTLQKLLRENNENPDNFFLFRRDGYFHNKHLLEIYCKRNPDITFYTDDEQMLHWATYDDSIHNFNVEILFPAVDSFIPLKDIYPNLREANDIVAMFQKGMFNDAYYESIKGQGLN